MFIVAARRNRLATALALTTAVAGFAAPSAADALVVAQAAADCADAKAHFDVAREIGTREALEVHVDNYGDCPFAPFARMLMDKLPANGAAATPPAGGEAISGTEPPAPAPAPVEAAEDAEARRVADAFVALLDEAAAVTGDKGAAFSYEGAVASGGDTRITGLQFRTPEVTYREQTRLRFAETVLVAPSLSDDGSLSAERIEASRGETTERHPGEETWVPVLNSDGNQLFVDRLSVDAPQILAAGRSEEDALLGRVRLEGLELGGLRFNRNKAPFFSIETISATTDRIEKQLPYQLKAEVSGFKVKGEDLADGSSEARAAFDALGVGTYDLGAQLVLEASSADRTVAIRRLAVSMAGGFDASAVVTLSNVDLAEGVADLMTGGKGPLKAMTLEFGTATYADGGLVGKLVDVGAKAAGIPADLLKAIAPAQAQSAALGFLGDKAAADQIQAAAADFLAAPKTLDVTVLPSRPPTVFQVVTSVREGPDAIKAAITDLGASLKVNDLPPIDLAKALRLASLPPETREAIETCHRLAADSDDPVKLAPGIKSPKDVDFAKALPACKAALDADPADPLIAFELGRSHYAAGDLDEAITFYKRAANGGHHVAIFELASAELTGNGLPADPPGAIRTFEILSDQLPIARSTLGSIYSTGIGVTADPAKAIAIWQAGADKGEAPSEYNLGVEHLIGTNVAFDAAKGRDLLRKAADQGHADAMAELGKSLFRGDGGAAPDYAAAFEWARKAADAGSSIGEANAGFMLGQGIGTQAKDPKTGAELLLRALAKGDADAEAYLITDKAKSFDQAFRKAVQAQMKMDGTYGGPITGLFGRQTTEALKRVLDEARS